MTWWPRKPSPQAPHLRAGAQAEALAEQYLRRQGLRTVHRNYRARRGEIDLVMHTGDDLVFVEVRHRRNGNYGGALASVTVSKQKKLISAASEYLVHHKISAQQACRFDVITIEGDLKQAEIHWIPNAFDLGWTGA